MEKGQIYQNQKTNRIKLHSFFLLIIFLVAAFLTLSNLKEKNKEEVKGSESRKGTTSDDVLSSETLIPSDENAESLKENVDRVEDVDEGEALSLSGEPDLQVNTTIESFTSSLKADSSKEIYDLLGSDLKSIFDLDSFTKSLSGRELKILDARIVKEITYVGEEFAQAELELTLSDGTISRYEVILKLEEDGWKIFGTSKL